MEHGHDAVAIDHIEKQSRLSRLSKDGKDEDELKTTHSPQSILSGSPDYGKQDQEHDTIGNTKQSPQDPEKSSLPDTDGASQMPLIREIPFLMVICSTNILAQAGLGMTVVPLDLVGKSFGSLSPGQLSWFVAAFSLTVGTFILVAGRLGDMHGHKKILILGFFFYGLCSLIAGFSAFSHSQILFDVCRALQGIGPAMMVPNSLAILGRVYAPGKRKDMVFSIYGATAPNGFICGALFGSLLAQLVWWPWEFWVMAITCFTLGIIGILVVPPDNRTGQDDGKAFDYYGAGTGVVGLVLFNIAWNQAPIVGWGYPYVIVFLVLGLSFFGLFLHVERKAEQPLFPRGALSGKAGFVLACIACGWSSFGIWVYYFFRLISHFRDVSPILASAQVVPAGISGICAAMTSGFILSRVPTSWVMAMAMLPFCIGNILLATVPVTQTYWAQSFLSIIITPWGMDMSFPAATIVLSNLVAKQHQGIAASLVVTVVNYSISIGLGIAGTIEVHVDEGGQNVLRGYRGAFFGAIGLSSIGFLVAMVFVWQEATRRRK